MSRHPDDRALDDSYAAITESTRRRQHAGIVEMSFVAAAAVLISVSTAFSAWNTFELRNLAKEEVETRQTILEGTECLVEQLAEHRHSNALGHRADAAHHGFVYPIPEEEEPAPVPGQLATSCERFITSTTTTESP